MSPITYLCAELGIEDPLRHSSCIGYGQRSPYCRNAVAHPSRSEAVGILKTITRHQQTSEDVEDEIYQLACLLLCKRNHQLQADEKVREWKQKIQKAAKRPARGEQSRASVANSSTSSPRVSGYSAVPAGSESEEKQKKRLVESMSNRRLLEELQLRLFEEKNDVLVEDFLRMADELRDTFMSGSGSQEVDVYDEEDDDEGSDVYSDSISSERPPVLNAIQTVGEDSALQSVASTTQNRPSPEALRRARTDALSTVPSTTAAFMHARPPSPIRQSHIECVVCLLPYGGDTGDFWQCDDCLNRVHSECFNGWCASALPRQAVRCIHCRAEV